MAGTQETLIATGCDPHCKWPAMVLELEQRQQAEQDEVALFPYEGDINDMRPSVEGYARLEEISSKYFGINSLAARVQDCKDACAPERYAEARVGFGSEVEVAIKQVKGE